MPIVSLKLNPSVSTEYTEALNEAGISDCQFIRIKSGLPQKLGGWDRYYQFAVNGVPKDIHAWSDRNIIDHLAIGTTTRLTVITNDNAIDITPQTFLSEFTPPNFSTVISSDVVNVIDPNINNVTTYDSVLFLTPVSVDGIILSGVYPIATVVDADEYTIIAETDGVAGVTSQGAIPEFDTTEDSALVDITFPAHGLLVGDFFTFLIPTTGGGVTIEGTYRVAEVSSVDVFKIALPELATSTANFDMNGGDVALLYYIALGPELGGGGYGTGDYGEGDYGLGEGTGGNSQTGDPIVSTDWTLDNWGEILIGCSANEGIYYWSPNGTLTNAQLVPNAPIFNGGIFVATPQQILVAWGSCTQQGTTFTEQRNPLQINWSDALDFTIWEVTSTTQAGGYLIPTGSRIVGGIQGPQQCLIWTDISIWSMSYVGLPFVFGFNEISSGCGLIGPHAIAILRGVVYWMSSGNFFLLAGSGVQSIPCSVWDYVYQNIDPDNQHKCVAAANSAFDEVAFYFPAIGSGGECSNYVKLNVEEGTWDFGVLDRCAWIDQSVLGQPIGASPEGIVFQHETSMNADGQAMNWYFETGWFVISEGDQIIFADWVHPDWRWGFLGGSQNATIMMTITTAFYPNGPQYTFGPFTMTNAVDYINCRLRGRLIKLRFEGSDLDSFARLGNMRYRGAADGRY